MKHFKYLILLIFACISFNTLASCEHGRYVAFIKSPGSVGSKHCVQYYEDKCEAEMQSGLILTADGKLPYAILTGKGCIPEIEPYECNQDVCPVTEQQTCPSTHKKGMYNGQLSCVKTGNNVLECNADYCFNPDNKFCPSGYVRGSMNDQAVCVKSSTNPNPTDPENPENNEQDNSEIKTKLGEIKTSLDTLNKTVGDSFTELKDLLSDFINNNSDNAEEENPNVNTSSLNAELPHVKYGDNYKSLNANIFVSSSSCPPDNTLSMNFLGTSFTYTFKYEPMCNALSFLGYFILIIAYLFAARIVTQA